MAGIVMGKKLEDFKIVCLKCKEPRKAIDGVFDMEKSEVVFNLECGHDIHAVIRIKEDD
jgi:hypothetical protein